MYIAGPPPPLMMLLVLVLVLLQNAPGYAVLVLLWGSDPLAYPCP